MQKKIKILIFILLMIPALTYAVLIALIKYDEISSGITANDMPAFVKNSKERHPVVLINSGPASLWKRISLIRQAKKNIELEYFIYDLDSSSSLITQELIKKSKEGVRVRVIVDFSMPVFKLNPFVAGFMKKSGIEVKYYNTTSMVNIWSTQHRSHRKLLLTDDRYAITGGRNIADDYFEVSSHYNFYDTDLFIEGEIVGGMRESFDMYWNSSLAVSAQNLETQFTDDEMQNALNFIERKDEVQKLEAAIELKGKELFEHSFKTECRDITFASDHPGTSVSKRLIYQILVQESDKARDNIWMESPYFVVRGEGLSLLKALANRKVKIMVLTNSLKSTDAYYTVSALSSNLKNLLFSGIELWAYGGKARSPEHLLEGQVTSERWGLHSKRGVIDDKTSLVGTYNIDPRSANLNSELIVVCRDNPELAQAIKSDMLQLYRNALPVVQDGCIECGKNLIKNADFLSIMKFFMILPIADRFDFLL